MALCQRPLALQEGRRIKKDKHSNELYNVPFYLQDDGADYDGDDSEEEHTEEEKEVLLNIENDAQGISSSRPPASTGPERAPWPPIPSVLSGNFLPLTEASSTSRTLPFHRRTQSQMTLPIGPVSITLPMPADVFHDLNEEDDILNTSYATGRPANSCNGASEKESLDGDDGDNEELLGMLEDSIKNTKNFVELMKETDIRKLLSGEESASQPVIQVFQFDKVTKAKCLYHGHDGKVTTT